MRNFFLSLLMVASYFCFSQKQAEVSLDLLDGNIIKGTTSLADIELVTAFGKLQIPIAKVSHIEIGIGKDNSVSQKVISNLKILSTSNIEDTRKAAYNDILKTGVKAIPFIQDFFNDPKNVSSDESYTGEFTIDNALSEIQSSNNLSSDLPKEDILTIDNIYLMGGNYNFTKLDIKTEYGNLSVPKEKIKTIDISVAMEPGSGEYSFKLNATKHISGNTNGGWLKTGVVLKNGQRFTLQTTGEVMLASLSNSKYKPDGSSKAETATEWTKPYGNEDEGGSSGGYPSYGQVVYRIGDGSSENLKAGSKFNGTAKKSGMLYISIYETVYNAANKGSYNVKLSLGK
ncbi:MAG: hypothetical protein Q8T03_10645 [Bacteroidota bacterium]|nr:hypothetical protein [Bacteroidota bacterium]